MDLSQNTQVPKKKHFSSKVKRVGCFTVFFSIILLFCIGVAALIWAGGWLKKTTCSIVLENSVLWEKSGCTPKEDTTSTSTSGEQNIINMDLLKSATADTEQLVTEIIDKASEGVVTVTVNQVLYDPSKGFVDQGSGIGSGFVVDSNGLIVTNQHVVSDTNSEYSVILPGAKDPIPVDKIYRDNVNDIALLKINKTGLKALTLGDSSTLKRGNLVIAIGSPFGELDGTATVGYVSGLNRDVTASDGSGLSSKQYQGVIQTDAAINPGNSGGPLINSNGEVIGINFATTMGAENISFAIPINTLKDRLQVFQKEGRFPQPYIGISYSQRTVTVKGEIITGAVVMTVEKGGPADTAGIKRGDVILKIDDKDLAENNLLSVIQTLGVGSKATLEVWRNGETIKAEVTIGDKSPQ